jgi:hypothetical protein
MHTKLQVENLKGRLMHTRRREEEEEDDNKNKFSVTIRLLKQDVKPCAVE